MYHYPRQPGALYTLCDGPTAQTETNSTLVWMHDGTSWTIAPSTPSVSYPITVAYISPEVCSIVPNALISGTGAPFQQYTQFGGSVYFSAQDIMNYPDLARVYDQYRIKGVTLVIDWLSNTAQTGGAVLDPAFFGPGLTAVGSSYMPTITYVEDNDDAAPPLSLQVIQQYQRFKKFTFRGDGKSLRIKLAPRPCTTAPVDVTGTTVSSNVVASNKTLFDCSANTIPYYGLKFWVNNFINFAPTPTAHQQGTDAIKGLASQLRFQMLYDLEMRDVR